MKRLLLRFGGFAVIPLLASLAPLLLLPIVARVGGVNGWASIATAQAIGGFGAVAVSFGWSLSGPPLVARSRTPAARRRIYAKAFSTRLIALSIFLPLLSLLSAVLASPEYVIDSVVMTVAMTTFGFSPAWYCIGLGRPRLIATYEAIPKFLATAAAACLLLFGFPIWTYPAVLILATISGLAFFQRVEIGAWWPSHSRQDGPLFRSVRRMLVPALVEVTGSTYAALPVPIVGVTSGTVVTSAFASADKLFRYGLFGITALANALQAWVLDEGGVTQRRRQISAIVAHVVLGLVGFAFLAFGGPTLTAVVFGEPLQAVSDVCGWYGVAYLLLSFSTPLMRNLLIPNGKTSVILRATIVSALVGIPTMILGTVQFGGVGAALGLAVSEAIVVVTIVPEAHRQFRQIRPTAASL